MGDRKPGAVSSTDQQESDVLIKVLHLIKVSFTLYWCVFQLIIMNPLIKQMPPWVACA